MLCVNETSLPAAKAEKAYFKIIINKSFELIASNRKNDIVWFSWFVSLPFQT